MLSIYFVNEEHKQNYKAMCNRWPNAAVTNRSELADPEYQVAVYITSVPMIFDKVGKYVLEGHESPLDWIHRYLLWMKKDRNELDWPEEELQELEEPPYDLTGSMLHLGKLAYNLWNSNKSFNLCDALGSFDGENVNVMLCAIYIRKGLFKDYIA